MTPSTNNRAPLKYSNLGSRMSAIFLLLPEGVESQAPQDRSGAPRSCGASHKRQEAQREPQHPDNHPGDEQAEYAGIFPEHADKQIDRANRASASVVHALDCTLR